MSYPTVWQFALSEEADRSDSHGCDLMVSEVPAEATLDRTYAKWVLGLSGTTVDALRHHPSRGEPIRQGV